MSYCRGNQVEIAPRLSAFIDAAVLTYSCLEVPSLIRLIWMVFNSASWLAAQRCALVPLAQAWMPLPLPRPCGRWWDLSVTGAGVGACGIKNAALCNEVQRRVGLPLLCCDGVALVTSERCMVSADLPEAPWVLVIDRADRTMACRLDQSLALRSQRLKRTPTAPENRLHEGALCL